MEFGHLSTNIESLSCWLIMKVVHQIWLIDLIISSSGWKTNFKLWHSWNHENDLVIPHNWEKGIFIRWLMSDLEFVCYLYIIYNLIELDKWKKKINRWLISDLVLGAPAIWLNLTNERNSKVLDIKIWVEVPTEEKIKKSMN